MKIAQIVFAIIFLSLWIWAYIGNVWGDLAIRNYRRAPDLIKNNRYVSEEQYVSRQIGLIGTLPFLPFIKLGGGSIKMLSHRWDWLEALLLVLVIIVLLTKLAIWRYWWLMIAGPSKPAPVRDQAEYVQNRPG